MTTGTQVEWPRYSHPDDLTLIEAVPLAERGLPATSYDLLRRAAERWPDRTALPVLPDAASWHTPRTRTYADLLADVHRTANGLQRLGVRRHDTVALLSPNCDELVTALLAAQLAGIATPVNPVLSRDHVAELIRRTGARVVITASPELDPEAHATCAELAGDGLVDHVLVLHPTAGKDTTAGLTYLAAGSPADRFLGEPPAARTWPPPSTPAARPAPRNSPPTPTPTRSPTPRGQLAPGRGLGRLRGAAAVTQQLGDN